MPNLSEVQNAIVSTQALIDRARAHLDAHQHEMTPEFVEHFEEQLRSRQEWLDRLKKLARMLAS